MIKEDTFVSKYTGKLLSLRDSIIRLRVYINDFESWRMTVIYSNQVEIRKENNQGQIDLQQWSKTS